MKKVTIVTSNAYRHVQKRGGFGCVILTPGDEIHLSQSYLESTCNRMELMAVVKGLEKVNEIYPNESCDIELVSKLTYLTNPFVKKAFKDKTTKGHVNYDLWERVYDLGKEHVWHVGKIKNTISERFHDCAVRLAHESFQRDEILIDEAYEKRSEYIPSCVDVVSLPDNINENLESPTLQRANRNLSIIEENNPPF